MPEFGDGPESHRSHRTSEAANNYLNGLNNGGGESFIGRYVARYIIPVGLWAGAGAFVAEKYSQGLPEKARQNVIIGGTIAGGVVGAVMGLGFFFSND